MKSNIMFSAIAPCDFNEVLGHLCLAMPVGLNGGAGSLVFLMPPIFRMAQGSIVPISRGGPPGLSD